MAFRQFTDPMGVEWAVYDVVPRIDERREYDRRDTSPRGEDAPDERRSADRRATVGTTRPGRLTRGWLCFEGPEERRRLQPIPENWDHLPDAELNALLQQARVAPRRANHGPGAGTGRP
jgi:hypothetical protein